MLKHVRDFFFILSLGLFSACSSVHHSTEQDAQLTKTSLINTQLGMAYLQNNNMQRAKQKFLLALDQAPHSPEAWYSMGYFQEVTGNSVLANEDYLKAIQLAPISGDVHNNYGTFLCRRGQYRNGIQHFLLAINDPRYLQSASAYENAGLCALKIPDTHDAANFFDHALKQDPNMPVSLFELAKLNYQFGKYKDAKSQLNQFLLISRATPQSEFFKNQLEKKV